MSCPVWSCRAPALASGRGGRPRHTAPCIVNPGFTVSWLTRSEPWNVEAPSPCPGVRPAGRPLCADPVRGCPVLCPGTAARAVSAPPAMRGWLAHTMEFSNNTRCHRADGPCHGRAPGTGHPMPTQPPGPTCTPGTPPAHHRRVSALATAPFPAPRAQLSWAGSVTSCPRGGRLSCRLPCPSNPTVWRLPCQAVLATRADLCRELWLRRTPCLPSQCPCLAAGLNLTRAPATLSSGACHPPRVRDGLPGSTRGPDCPPPRCPGDVAATNRSRSRAAPSSGACRGKWCFPVLPKQSCTPCRPGANPVRFRRSEGGGAPRAPPRRGARTVLGLAVRTSYKV